MNIACPKCGFESPESATECPRCGIVFGKYESEPVPPRRALPVARESELDDDDADGRIGPKELKILGFGFVAAVIVYAIPFTRFVFSAMVTLFHEFGHAVVGWLLGYPSIPAFDFVYGGGLTPHGNFHLSIAIGVAAGFGWLAWFFRGNRTTAALIGVLFLIWLFVVTAEWRRDILFSAAGHMAEYVLAAILFYQALAGIGWRNPDVERPLGAFVAFFVQFNAMSFAWRLMHDPDFLAWYREGKGGMLMNDLESIALDLHIHTSFNPGIVGAARLLLLFGFVPIAVALIWFFRRSQWHRLLGWQPATGN